MSGFGFAVSTPSLSLLSASAAPSVLQSEAVQELFAPDITASAPKDGFMAHMANPANGFAPYNTDRGTEVLFLSNPSQLPYPLGYNLTPQWHNGLGLILFRNEEVGALGAIFIHGAMKTPWSALGKEAWQALGGIMAFTGTSFEEAIEMVLGKGMAMTPKWRFIDRSLAAVGHPHLTELGGAKAILLHGEGEEAKIAAIRVAAEVARSIGIYISGCDQNMGPTWANFFASEAPFNFMGAEKTGEGYRGMRNPSPFTARGIVAGIDEVQQILLRSQVPIFVQGYGGVGKVLVGESLAKGWEISALSDATVDALLTARDNGLEAPLFLDTSGTEAQFGAERKDVEVGKAGEHTDITIVNGLREALQSATNTGILSPNAGPHPITLEVVQYLLHSGIRAIVGAANNMLGLIDGSSEMIAWLLQRQGIFVPNDSRINRQGALSVTVKRIGLDATGMALQSRQVGLDVREEITEAFRQGIAPQIYSDRLAARAWNALLAEGRAIGGRFAMPPLFPPPDEELRKLRSGHPTSG